VWKPFLLSACCIAGVALAAVLVGGVHTPRFGDGIEWATSLGCGELEPVLVLLVADRAGVAAVRAAVDPGRILAETSEAIVLREGRVVATKPEAVGEPLVEAGFGNRSIELWAINPRGPRKRAQSDDEALSVAALAAKPTLTPLEVLAILDGSVSGVEL
jgi:hypothetical protein